MTALLFLLDLAILLLSTLRLVRLVITDDIPFGSIRLLLGKDRIERLGLDCPFCCGFWIGVLGLLVLWLVGGPGDAADWWRYAAGAFALNWLAAHIGGRLGDAGYAD